MSYHAKFLLRRFGANYTQVREFLLSRSHQISHTSVSDIFNHGQWPKRNTEKIKRDLQAFLKRLGAAPDDLERAWEKVPQPAKSKSGQTPEQLLLRRRIMLTPEIIKKLGLNKDPFDTELESVDDVLATPPMEAVVKKMVDAARKCKFIGVHGPVGSGKTIAKMVFMEKLLREKNYLISEPAIIEKSKCLPSSIMKAMLDDFLYNRSRSNQMDNIWQKRGDLEEKSRWVHAMLRTRVKQGKKLVLVIDEAHDLRPETLRALKRFHEMQEGFRKLLSIIIIGQEELLSLLSGNFNLREVSVRINLVEMKPIKHDVEDYLAHKFERAGGVFSKILDRSALDAIKSLLSNPIPITLNNLASASIEKAYELDHFPVNAEIVETAFRSIKNTVA